MTQLTESQLKPETASHSCVLAAGDPWMRRIARGQTLRIVDMEGNQAADTLFYNASDTAECYSAQQTIVAQGGLYLTTGSPIVSSRGNVLLRVTADTCGRHDTLGGACSCESNMVRYALEKRHMHSCRDSFLRGLRETNPRMGKRDISHNINFFMNVPVTPEGGLCFADGVSASGRYVEMRAEMDVFCLISNCPQLNNPCNAYNPTPLQILIWE